MFEQKKQARRLRPLTKTLLIAAAILVLAGTAVAATYGLWSPSMARLFSSDSETQQSLLDNGSTALLDASVTTENGLEIAVEQALYDGRQLTLSLRMTAPEDGWFTKENKRDFAIYCFTQLTMGGQQLMDDSGGWCNDQADNTGSVAYYFLTYETDLTGQTDESMTLSFRNASSEPLDCPLIADGVSISWQMSLEALPSYTDSLEHVLQTQDGTLHLSGISVTAVSITYEMNNDDLDAMSGWDADGVRLADGTEIPFAMGGWTRDDDDPSPTTEAYYTFESVVADPTQIVGLCFRSEADSELTSEVAVQVG